MKKEYKLLTIEINDRGVGLVGLNRPQVHNAFDSELIAELTSAFEELGKNTKVRFVVLFGHGKSFCAGGDLNWMRSMKQFGHEENIADSEKLAKMYSTIGNFSKPLIGIVHGAALGGGSGLAAVCDFVVAAEDAKFGFTEARIGILPAVIAPYAIEKIGISAARAYFTSGMQFPATIAKEIGLAHRVVPRESLDAAREEIISEFFKAAPSAACNAKALIKKIVALTPDRKAITAATIAAIADARVSDEGQEGMDALLSGRKAKWAV